MHLNLKYSSSRKQVELDVMSQYLYFCLNPSNAELNPIFQLLALLSHPILHVGGIRVNALAVDKGWFIHSHNLAKFKSRMPIAGIRSSPYSPRWQDKG